MGYGTLGRLHPTHPIHPMIPTARLRQWHSYIGLFIAPSMLFFALTGALQIFNLHEAHGGYRPAALIEKLSAVHKDQVFERPHERDQPPPEAQGSGAPAGAGAATGAGAAAGAGDDDDDKLAVSTLALKWFFLLVAAGLVFSTSIGIWMGVTQIRKKALAGALLAAGTLLPIALLLAA
jgi:hypothetical protein